MSALVPIDPSLITNGPGCIRIAPIGTTVPANVAATSTFAADVWPTGWLKVGPTMDGIGWSPSISSEKFFVAESLNAVFTPVTEQSVSISFTLVENTFRTIKLALNGGATSATGSGVTLSTKYSPPSTGAQVPWMIGWESDDLKFRFLWYSCLQTGSPDVRRSKGNNYAQFALTWEAQQPDPAVSADAWNYWQAGATVVV